MARQIEEHTSALTQTVQQTEDRFRNAFDHAPIGMALVSPEGRWLEVNQVLCDITGFSEQELVERTFQDITHPDDLEADLDSTRRMLAGEISSFCMEKRYVRKDGQLVWILLSVSRSHSEMGKPFLFVAQVQDITERKWAEQALTESNARLQAVLDASTQVGLVSIDTEGLITTFNTGAERLFGYAAEEMIGRQTPLILCIEAELAARAEELTRTLGRSISGIDVFLEPARLGDVSEREVTCVRKDGSHMTAGLVVTAMRGPSGTIIGFMGIVSDITEPKRIESALRESERRFRRIMTNVLDFVAQVTTECTYEYVAPSSLALLGYPSEELRGKSVFSILHPDDIDEAVTTFSSVIRSGDTMCGEFRCRHADGRYLWFRSAGKSTPG